MKLFSLCCYALRKRLVRLTLQAVLGIELVGMAGPVEACEGIAKSTRLLRSIRTGPVGDMQKLRDEVAQ